MPLPWLKNERKVAGLIIEHRKPDGGMAEEASKKSEENPGLSEAASALLQAVKAEDTKGIAEALKDAFEILDSQPHHEGPHEETEG